MNCHCGSKKPFSECCEPLILGLRQAKTAEELMRSRYSAYVVGATTYLIDTIDPDSRYPEMETDLRNWIESSEWLGLEIVNVKEETVEFIAHYRQNGKKLKHHERSAFKKVSGRWICDPLGSTFP